MYVDVTGTMHVKGTDGVGASGTTSNIPMGVKEVLEEHKLNAVFATKYFTFYKDALVIRHSNDFLTSWSIGGIIFLNHNLDAYSYEYRANYLKHEYGHILQEKLIGIDDYILYIALPSALFNLISRGKNPVGKFIHENYYNPPWEYTADIIGNVDRQHAEYAFSAALAYFASF